MRTLRIDLPENTGGTRHTLDAHIFGEESARPSAHIQAGLHADKVPAFLVAHHLVQRLEVLEREGRIAGRVTVVPVANPIGLSQRVLGVPEGRFDLSDGDNFNRGFPDLAEAVADAAARSDLNLADLLREAVQDSPAPTPKHALRRKLLSMAIGEDVVLDLHTNKDAVVHLFAHEADASRIRPLAALLEAPLVFLTPGEAGDLPFDEAVSRPAHHLASAVPDRDHRPALAATLELRGQRDVNHEVASHDADAIIAFLALQGVLSPAQGAAPPNFDGLTVLSSEATAAEAPHHGVLVYRQPRGVMVRDGDILAEIVDPVSGVVTPVPSPASGLFYSRTGAYYAVPGEVIAQVARVG